MRHDEKKFIQWDSYMPYRVMALTLKYPCPQDTQTPNAGLGSHNHFHGYVGMGVVLMQKKSLPVYLTCGNHFNY